MGIRFPTQYAAWLELVLISMISPNASFLGHLAGILAGYLYVHGPIDAVLWIPRQCFRTIKLLLFGRDGVTSRTTYGSGYARGSADARSSDHVDVGEEIELEYEEDLQRHQRDHTYQEYVDSQELRERRMRRYNNIQQQRR